MDQLTNAVVNTANWIRNDFREWPLRFTLEVTAWALSIMCAVWMGLTLPNPPFMILYPLFMTQCGIFAWAAWTRQSFGMLSNYVLLMSIDAVALSRLIYITYF